MKPPFARHHGGPDAQGAARWDFSTNANACGPEPSALQAVRSADATRYPDPQHSALREALAQLHDVSAPRIVIAASGSEFIQRLTGLVARRWPTAVVQVPVPGYGDYAHAARAHGLAVVEERAAVSSHRPCLVWHTEPSSPGGQAQPAPAAGAGADTLLVTDRAYAPLRLQGEAPAVPDHAWQLWSPNKALGLTGVRGAYAIAPATAGPWPDTIEALESLAPSWPLGAHGVAMLMAWAQPAAQVWVRASLATLREWKAQQIVLCEDLGWTCESSVTPFFVAHWPNAKDARLQPDALLPRLRAQGVQLRNTASMGRPGAVRLSVQPPAAQRALAAAWRSVVAAGRADGPVGGPIAASAGSGASFATQPTTQPTTPPTTPPTTAQSASSERPAP